jgi:hypothetical protein
MDMRIADTVSRQHRRAFDDIHVGLGRRAVARLLSALLVAFAVSAAGSALADEAPARESMDDAWWNGPLLTFPAITIPAGTFAAGAALLDEISHDGSGVGNATPAPGLNECDFRSALIYGVSDDFNLGLLPLVGLGQLPQSKGGSNLELGDWIVEGQYKLHDFRQGDWMPTISFDLAETFPTGRYDRLGPFGDPLGAGTYVTTLALYTQSLFWMPTGRILRAEFNLSYALSSQVGLRGMSVYGTPDGFSGNANPGSSILGDLTLEYSLSRSWSVATEIQLEQDNPTHVAGTDISGAPIQISSGLGRVLYVTPFLEYGWSPTESLGFGTRIYAAGHNETPTVTPVILFTRYFGGD